MKITQLQTFHVKPRWLFLKVHTDEGLVGWGEPVVEGRAQTTETAVHELGRMIVGRDPRRIEDLWQMMYRGTFYRGGPILSSAISGIEQALWDILGKSLGVPVHQLLGGAVRDRIRCYTHLRPREGESYAACLKRILPGSPFRMFKWSPLPRMHALESKATMDRIIRGISDVRDVAGPDIDLAVDFHGRATPAVSIQLAKALEPCGLLFIEEPVLPGDTLALRRISSATTIPIATGERLFTRWQFQDIIEQEAVAVVQPDLSHCGGIFEARKIAAMAESRNLAVAPHCPLGPITLATSLQLAACTPNFLCQEQVSLGDSFLKTPFSVVDGHIALPTAPGLGIDVDEDKVRAAQFPGDWDTPQWRLDDGGYAEY